MDLTAEETSIVASFAPASVREAGEAAPRVPSCAGIVEVRLDRMEARPDLGAIRRAFSGRRLLATLRSAAEGGAFGGRSDERRRLLLEAAAAGFDLVDVEFRSSGGLLEELPAGRVVLSIHDTSGVPADLDGLLAAMEATGAAHLKIVATARDSRDALALLRLQRSGRGRLSCFGMGEAGIATRVLSPYLGARLAFGALDAAGATAPGQLPAADLSEVYGIGRRRPAGHLFALLGGAVSHSLSPALHNANFEAHGLASLYVPFALRSLAEEFAGLVAGLDSLGLPLRGASVTVPFKEEAAVAADSGERGAANTLLRTAAGFSASNTDRAAFVSFLPEPSPGGRALVLGAGGTARAALDALRARGWAGFVASRTPSRAREVAEATGSTPLESADGTGPWDVVVNATPLGMKSGDPLPCPPGFLRPGVLVIDAPYRPGGTPLALAARRAGASVRDGLELLVAQAALQAALFTGVGGVTAGQLLSRLPERIRKPFEVTT